LKIFSITEAVTVSHLSKIKTLIWLVIIEGIHHITFFLSHETCITKIIILHKVVKYKGKSWCQVFQCQSNKIQYYQWICTSATKPRQQIKWSKATWIICKVFQVDL